MTKILFVCRQYLPQPVSDFADEGLVEESGAGVTIPYRVGGHQPGGDWQSGLSPGAAQAIRVPESPAAVTRATAANRTTTNTITMFGMGQRRSAEYAPHLRWWPDGNSAFNGLHRPPRRCCRPVVHRRFRGNLAGCAGGLPRLLHELMGETKNVMNSNEYLNIVKSQSKPAGISARRNTVQRSRQS